MPSGRTTRRLRSGLAGSVAALVLPLVISGGEGIALASGPALQEQADALMKNIEDMMAHGGMGDAKAIVHHCGEASRYAGTLLAQLPESDLRRSDAKRSLNEIIRQCQRVADIGIHADPGQLLNPAIKARAAARELITLLGLARARASEEALRPLFFSSR